MNLLDHGRLAHDLGDQAGQHVLLFVAHRLPTNSILARQGKCAFPEPAHDKQAGPNSRRNGFKHQRPAIIHQYLNPCTNAGVCMMGNFLHIMMYMSWRKCTDARHIVPLPAPRQARREDRKLIFFRGGPWVTLGVGRALTFTEPSPASRGPPSPQVWTPRTGAGACASRRRQPG